MWARLTHGNSPERETQRGAEMVTAAAHKSWAADRHPKRAHEPHHDREGREWGSFRQAQTQTEAVAHK